MADFGSIYAGGTSAALRANFCWRGERCGAGDSHFQCCQAGPRWVPKSSPSSSRSEQQVSVSATRPSAGDGIISLRREAGFRPNCVALPWPSVWLDTSWGTRSSAQQPSGPPYRIPTSPQPRHRHHARAEHVRGCSPAVMLCNLCLGEHRSPGDSRRVGKMLSHSDTKAFPSSAGTCPLRWFDVQPLAPIQAHHSAFCNLSVGGPRSHPSHDPPGLPLRSAVSRSQESRCCSTRCVCFQPSVSSHRSPPPIPPWRNVACAPKAARRQLLTCVMGVQTGELQSGNGHCSAVLGLWK